MVPGKTSRVRRLRFWAIYVLTTTIVVILLLEAALRVIGLAPQLPEQYKQHVSDPVLPWKFEPNSTNEGRTAEFAYSYRHNSEGFRDVERAKEKPADTFRILVIGDSFTYGVGASFEQTYPARLEQILNEHFHGTPRIEVVNRGMARYWPEAERLVLQHYGLAYKPDLVLVGFAPNDVLDTYVGIRELTVNQGFLVTRSLDGFGGTGSWLYVHSRVFGLLFAKFVTTQLARDAARTLTLDASEIYKPDGLYNGEWQQIESEYDRMIALAEEVGSQFGLIYIPQSGPWPPSQFPYPQQRLAAWASARGVTFTNTAPDLEAAATRGRVFYAQDGHCTPKGYDVIARAVATRLLSSPILQIPKGGT